MTTKQSPAETQPRVVRVFISSTFRDMQAERDELVKRIFPQLRKLCDERGVTWGEVDLRWGITDEQSAEGQVLPICLAEIQNCRPYFIGLLGERYGWVPDAFPQELIESESWLAEQSGNSVTELEILHGVLNDPEMAQHAFFYFRDPAYLNSLPEGERQEFLEGASQEEIEKYGKDEAERRAEARRQKLDALKERIRSSEFLVRENYPNPEALGEMVLNDLTALINRLYPEGEKIDALDREAMEHEAYATSRAKVYVKRQEYFDRLNKHVAGDDIPLIVLGESGSGKSALLASWALEYRKVHPNDLLLMHFIGSSPYSSDWAAMLRRIMSEFKRRFDIREEIPDKPDALRTAFANWLHMVSAKGRVILILDALNQLEDRDGALDLVWLPPVIPENIRLILSTLPGKSLDELKKRGWSTTQVKPLDEEERKRLIAEYLAQYKKALNQRQIELIASAPQSSNPLFVRALLDELRVFGIHELLDQRISHYLGARNIPELYSKILERYEQDYDNKRQELVRDTMLLVESARRGLSETELLELLGADGKPMPRAYWSPFYVTADQALVSHSGLITFAHDYLRQAVHDRYLSTEQEQHDCHIRLANYFESQPTSERKIDELPWQLAQAKEWQRLHNLLSDPEFFESAWEMNQFEVKAYWVQVESNSSLSLVQAYKEMLNKPNISDRIFWFTKNLYSDTGHLDESLYMVDFLVDTYRKIGDHANLAVSLGDRSAILWARGDFDEAMKLLKEQEQISHELGDKEELVRSLGNQALILKARGDPHQAMILLKEQESICREYNNKGKLGICLSNQGMILFDRGDLDGAMELFKEHERICRELGEKDLLSYALDSQASILRARGDLDGAMALCEQAEQICREVGHKEGLGRELSSLGSISFERGDLDKAMKLYKEAEHIGRGLGDAKNLYYAFEGQGLVFERRGNPEEAMKLFKDAERICRKLEYKAGLLKCLGHQARIQYADRNFEEVMKLQKEVEDIARLLGDKAALSQSLNTQSSILADRGDLNGAMKLLTEHENLCYELGDKEGAATSIDNQANIVYRHGDLDKAMKLYKEEERILRELGNKNGLQHLLGGQAWILKTRGDLNGAIKLFKEQELICREVGNKNGLAASLNDQASILRARGDLDGAMALYKEVEEKCRELGDKNELERSVQGQGIIHNYRGDLDSAMALFKEAERLCRDLGNKKDLALAGALGKQAVILQVRGALDEARRLHMEEERIYRELGDMDGLATCLGNQANLRISRHDLPGAMTLLKEQEKICRELGNKDGLQGCLCNQGMILLQSRDTLDSAMALLKEQEKICRELDLYEGLATSLINQAMIYLQKGIKAEASRLSSESFKIAQEHGYQRLAQQIASIKQRFGI